MLTRSASISACLWMLALFAACGGSNDGKLYGKGGSGGGTYGEGGATSGGGGSSANGGAGNIGGTTGGGGSVAIGGAGGAPIGGAGGSEVGGSGGEPIGGSGGEPIGGAGGVPPTGGGGGTGGNPDGKSVACAGSACPVASQYCCASLTGTHCNPINTNCGYGTNVFCDGPEDCDGGQVCCGELDGSGAFYWELRCVAGYACDYNQNRRIFCGKNPGVCPSGTTCKQSSVLPGYYVCSTQ